MVILSLYMQLCLPSFISVCLIEADVGNINTRIGRFANYLRNLLPSNDTGVMELAAHTVGMLALVSGTYAAEYFEFEVKRAFEWLGGDRNEGKRLAAVRIYLIYYQEPCTSLMCHILILIPFSGFGAPKVGTFCPHIFLSTSSDLL